MNLKEWWVKHRVGWYRPEYKKAFLISSIVPWCGNLALLGVLIWVKVNNVVVILYSDMDMALSKALLIILFVIAVSVPIPLVIVAVDEHERKIGEKIAKSA